ncbi:MAG TPA: site-specific integrase [Gaiellaceae bacterium]|nr:site-specific integrase [Gaiellaceae bacterium]
MRTQKLALALERQWQDEQDARRLGLPVDRGPIAFGDLCDRYLAQHQVTARTLRSLRERLVYSRRPFGTTPVRELLAEEIGRWNASLPVGATMRGHCLRAMAQVLDAGVRWGYLPTNPAREVRRPSASVHEVRPFESWDEVEAVANAAGTYGALIRFACATGLRPQEWQVLRWADVDLAGRTCRVARTLRDGVIVSAAKTGGSLRTIVLQRRAVVALQSLPRPLHRETLVFPAPEGGVVSLSNFRRRVWQPALAAAGLESRPIYEMRHTFATLALSAGAPLEWISNQLGHADTRVTLRHYARFLPAADERALALLDSFADQGGRVLDAAADV